MSDVASFIAIAAIVASVFVVLFFLSGRKSSQEVGLAPLYESRCQVIYGDSKVVFAGGNLPLGRIAIYEKFMVVSFMGNTVIPYERIDSIFYKRSLFLKSVILYIKRVDSKICIRVKPRKPERVIELLQARMHRKIVERGTVG